jgi:hypothetical protein
MKPRIADTIGRHATNRFLCPECGKAMNAPCGNMSNQPQKHEKNADKGIWRWLCCPNCGGGYADKDT